jgi:STE24 endopeptidase
MIFASVQVNAYFIFLLAAILGLHILDMVSTWWNVRASAAPLPEEFRDVYDAEKYRLSQQYAKEAARMDTVESNVLLMIFLGFWIGGGYAGLDEFVRSISNQDWLRGLIFVAILYVLAQLIKLPFGIYSTFGLEAKYGFNRTSVSTFVVDLVKGFVLAALLGLPFFALIQFILETWGAQAWWIGWLAMAVLTVFLTWLAPRWILPWFYEFRPLANDLLQAEIKDLAKRCQFPVTEVLEVDGSRRSARANAFFTGMGKNKKIALYDTLIAQHPTEELVAVLAHEIGHYKLRHVIMSLLFAILQAGIVFWILGQFLNHPGLFAAFGISQLSVYASLVLFSFLLRPLTTVLGLISLAISRRNEFAADAYASKVTGNPLAMISGLKRLARDNLTNLTPHPLYVALNYSHPPMRERVAALKKFMTGSDTGR